MATVPVYESEGQVLFIDSDDIEAFATPIDVIDKGRNDQGAYVRELGKRHLNLTFKRDAKSPYWVKKEEANNG